MSSPYPRESSQSYLIPILLLFFSITISVSILSFARLVTILFRPQPTSFSTKRPSASRAHPTHLLIVLGSGGHTTEMLNMLRHLLFLPAKFTHRTYVVSSGDSFSALKAKEFEMEMAANQVKLARLEGDAHGREALGESYDIVTVRRARRVHQSLLSTPWSASLCLWDCLMVLMGTPYHLHGLGPKRLSNMRRPGHPDLILTNGPGTGVCVVLASLVLLFFGCSGPSLSSSEDGLKGGSSKESSWQHSGEMRSIFIESWARVKTLSLSGKILLPVVDRFLVQWPGLEGRGGGKAEFVGSLVV
jgi:beta-1,4-N-acetylglucosaminyltransferase